MQKLVTLMEEGRALPVSIPELTELEEKIDEVRHYEARCKKCIEELSQEMKSEGKEDKGLDYLKQILKLRAEINKLGVTN